MMKIRVNDIVIIMVRVVITLLGVYRVLGIELSSLFTSSALFILHNNPMNEWYHSTAGRKTCLKSHSHSLVETEKSLG